MEEKIRACREVALTMQLDDRAEYEAEKVRATFSAVLGDEARGRALFEHIRYRAGLLIERRTGVFAFAHLTFQEYLAARAVHEGNHVGIVSETLAHEHHDGRWKEVIALYCGLAPAPAARSMLQRLIAQDDSPEIAAVLAEAYFTAGNEIHQDRELRTRIVERLARAQGRSGELHRFPEEEVASLANSVVGTIRTYLGTSAAYGWLMSNPQHLDRARLRERIFHRTTESPVQLSELIYLAFMCLDAEDVAHLTDDPTLLSSRGPSFNSSEAYSSQASIAILGFLERRSNPEQEAAISRIIPRLLDPFLSGNPMAQETFIICRRLEGRFSGRDLPADDRLRRELAARVARLIDKAEEYLRMGEYARGGMDKEVWERMRAWVKELDSALTAAEIPIGRRHAVGGDPPDASMRLR